MSSWKLIERSRFRGVNFNFKRSNIKIPALCGWSGRSALGQHWSRRRQARPGCFRQMSPAAKTRRSRRPLPTLRARRRSVVPGTTGCWWSGPRPARRKQQTGNQLGWQQKLDVPTCATKAANGTWAPLTAKTRQHWPQWGFSFTLVQATNCDVESAHWVALPMTLFFIAWSSLLLATDLAWSTRAAVAFATALASVIKVSWVQNKTDCEPLDCVRGLGGRLVREPRRANECTPSMSNLLRSEWRLVFTSTKQWFSTWGRDPPEARGVVDHFWGSSG